MKFFACTVLFSLFFSLFSRLGICINYFINQEYYATVLCEKKDEVESCCRGKCAMEKELVNIEEKEENQSSNAENSTIKFSKVEEALCQSLKLFIEKHFISCIETPFFGKTEKGNLHVLIKPPCVHNWNA